MEDAVHVQPFYFALYVEESQRIKEHEKVTAIHEWKENFVSGMEAYFTMPKENIRQKQIYVAEYLRRSKR